MSKLAEMAVVAMPIVLLCVEIALPALVALVLLALRKWLAAQAHERHRRTLVDLCYNAYLIVNQIARRTPGKLDDKIAEALREVAVQLGRDLTDSERALATAELRSQHEAHLQNSIVLSDLPEGSTRLH